ncbi:MAG: hypothetical protein KOO63_01220 [Bacteroidales bacterium]|nr:hypothetical protein [Candidatus Latescibacterota bacterium]
MSTRKLTTLAVITMIVIGALSAGCDNDNNYDERTVVYVSNVNEGYPFISDVLNQGDELFIEDDPANGYNIGDDYIIEDWMKVEFHNRPYNSVVDPNASSLGDFLVTSYEVEFTRLDGNLTPVVADFTGLMSLMVPADSKVEAVILIVPYGSKLLPTLSSLQYNAGEVMAHAQITFHGHEIQTERNINFSAGVIVTFADVLTDEDPNDH